MRTRALIGNSATTRTWQRGVRLSLFSVCALALEIAIVPVQAQAPAFPHDDPKTWLIAQGSQVPFPKIDGGGGISRPTARQTTPSAPFNLDQQRINCMRDLKAAHPISAAMEADLTRFSEQIDRMYDEILTRAFTGTPSSHEIRQKHLTEAQQRLPRDAKLGILRGNAGALRDYAALLMDEARMNAHLPAYTHGTRYRACIALAEAASYEAARGRPDASSARTQVPSPPSATIPAPAPAPAPPVAAQNSIPSPSVEAHRQSLLNPLLRSRPEFKEGLETLEQLVAEGAGKDEPRQSLTEPKPDEAGTDAKQCLEVRLFGGPTDENQLHNVCSYWVSGMWCAEGYDCKPSFTNMHNFEPGKGYTIQGTDREGQNRMVYYGGCQGKDSIHGSPRRFAYYCKKVPN